MYFVGKRPQIHLSIFKCGIPYWGCAVVGGLPSGTPWTSHQLIAGPTYSDKPFTPKVNTAHLFPKCVFGLSEEAEVSR